MDESDPTAFTRRAFRRTALSAMEPTVGVRLPAALAAAVLVLRTSWEDRLLRAELHGYADYARRVRARLLPGVW